MITPEQLIEKLELSPHPEGGFYREIYASDYYVKGSLLSGNRDGNRSLSTSIYYLLRSGDVSKFHRLRSDEIWYYHLGSPVLIYTLTISGELDIISLGCDVDNEEVPQVVIPAGTVFGAEVRDKDSFSLVGCMVSPGFHFDDFELMNRAELLEKYPAYKDVIIKLTLEF